MHTVFSSLCMLQRSFKASCFKNMFGRMLNNDCNNNYVLLIVAIYVRKYNTM